MKPQISIALPHLDTFLKRYESKATVKAYTSDLEIFRKFLMGHGIGGIQGINIPLGIEYRAFLAKEYSKGTANRRLASAKAYLSFLVRLGELYRNPFDAVELFRNAEYDPTPGLSNAETAAMLDAAKNSPRDSAMLHVLFYLGLRRAELIDLNIDSLGANMGIPTLSIVGKGRKTRSIPIPNPVFESLKLYLTTRICKEKTSEPLFLSSKNKRFHPESIPKLIQKYATKAGITKKVSPHMARVTCVSNALENGAPIETVQYLGGWASLHMVIRYDRRRQDLKRSAAYKVKYSSG